MEIIESKQIKNRKIQFISAILGSIYVAIIIIMANSWFFLPIADARDFFNAFGSLIILLLMIPHTILVIIALSFNWVGYRSYKKSYILTSAILYSVSGLLFIPNIIWISPMIIMLFITHSKMQ